MFNIREKNFSSPSVINGWKKRSNEKIGDGLGGLKKIDRLVAEENQYTIYLAMLTKLKNMLFLGVDSLKTISQFIVKHPARTITLGLAAQHNLVTVQGLKNTSYEMQNFNDVNLAMHYSNFSTFNFEREFCPGENKVFSGENKNLHAFRQKAHGRREARSKRALTDARFDINHVQTNFENTAKIRNYSDSVSLERDKRGQNFLTNATAVRIKLGRFTLPASTTPLPNAAPTLLPTNKPLVPNTDTGLVTLVTPISNTNTADLVTLVTPVPNTDTIDLVTLATPVSNTDAADLVIPASPVPSSDTATDLVTLVTPVSNTDTIDLVTLATPVSNMDTADLVIPASPVPSSDTAADLVTLVTPVPNTDTIDLATLTTPVLNIKADIIDKLIGNYTHNNNLKVTLNFIKNEFSNIEDVLLAYDELIKKIVINTRNCFYPNCNHGTDILEVAYNFEKISSIILANFANFSSYNYLPYAELRKKVHLIKENFPIAVQHIFWNSCFLVPANPYRYINDAKPVRDYRAMPDAYEAIIWNFKSDDEGKTFSVIGRLPFFHLEEGEKLFVINSVKFWFFELSTVKVITLDPIFSFFVDYRAKKWEVLLIDEKTIALRNLGHSEIEINSLRFEDCTAVTALRNPRSLPKKETYLPYKAREEDQEKRTPFSVGMFREQKSTYSEKTSSKISDYFRKVV